MGCWSAHSVLKIASMAPRLRRFVSVRLAGKPGHWTVGTFRSLVGRAHGRTSARSDERTVGRAHGRTSARSDERVVLVAMWGLQRRVLARLGSCRRLLRLRRTPRDV